MGDYAGGGRTPGGGGTHVALFLRRLGAQQARTCLPVCSVAAHLALQERPEGLPACPTCLASLPSLLGIARSTPRSAPSPIRTADAPVPWDEPPPVPPPPTAAQLSSANGKQMANIVSTSSSSTVSSTSGGGGSSNKWKGLLG